MARSQELRRVENKKRTLGLQLKHGIPNVNDLREGENEFRSTSEGVVEYIKLNNVLYKQVLEQVNVPSTVQPAISQASDYDSGWIDVDRTDTDKDTYTLPHDLTFNSYSPTLCQIFLCDLYGATSPSASATNIVYPYRGGFELDIGGSNWGGTDVRIDDTNVYIQAYASYYAFWTYQDDSGTAGTHKYFSRIGLKVLLWK
jgi:hypothetical protein